MTDSELAPEANGVRLIKLRPVCRAPGHLGDFEWKSLLYQCGMEVDGNIPRLRYPSHSEYRPFMSWILEELRSADEVGLTIFDACMRADNRALDLCLESLGRALHELSEIEESKYRILVVTGLPSRRPGGIFDLLDEETWDGKLWVLTTDGTLHGGNKSPFEEVARGLRPMIDPTGAHVCLRQVRANLIRVRGVFEDTSAPGKHFGYRYVLDHDAHEPAAQLVATLARRISARIILAETTSSPWLTEVINHLRFVVGSDDIQVRGFTHEDSYEELSQVARSGAKILILAGVTMAGSVATRVCDALGIDSLSNNVSRAAIVCHADGDPPSGTDLGGWMTTEKNSGEWYYLVGAAVPTYTSSDWRVRAARICDEVGNLNTPIRRGIGQSPDVERLLDPILPGRVGLLDLWAELGSTPELREGADESVAWREPSHGVRYLPDLAGLDPKASEAEFNDFDANWLAEAIIEGCCQLVGKAHRRDLVILAPEPKSAAVTRNGVDKVVDAMLHTRRVKAIRVPRDSIHLNRPLMSRDEEYIKVWKGASFIAFDEIAVTMKTLNGISEWASALGCPLDAVASLIDVDWPDRVEVTEPHFTLARWSHLAETSPC